MNEGTAAELAKEFFALKQAQKYTCKTKGMHPKGGMCGFIIASDKTCGAHPDTECSNKLEKESQRYKEPTIDEGQKIRNLWEQVTSKPLTSREIMFYRLIVDSLDWSKYFESPPSEIHEELISLRKDYQAIIDRAKFTVSTGEGLTELNELLPG